MTERLCTICERNSVFSTDEEKDYCLFCYLSGRYFVRVLSSDERSNMLPRIREIEKVNSVEIWHNGQGMFSLGIMLQDGRMIVPGVPGEVFGQAISVPMIPPTDGEWRLTIIRPVEDEDEWSQPPTVLPDTVDDDGLVKLIEEIA